MQKKTRKTPLFFIDLYNQFVNDSISGKRLQPNGKKVSKGTITSYQCTLKLLKNFSNIKNFDIRVNQTRYLNKRGLVTERNNWRKFYKRFTEYLHNDCNHFDNYVGLNIKNIRTSCGYLNKVKLLGIGDFYKQLYVRKEQIPIVTLLPEELNHFIYNKQFENTLPAKMKRVKDVFVFGCTVALRFSDLMALKKPNLRKINDDYYLVVRSGKTSTDTQIKLPDYTIEILKKYKKIRGGYLLPRFNMVNLNKYVKELAERSGFIQSAPKLREVRGKVVEQKITSDQQKKSYRFCDQVSTHTMRRTAITTMLCLGMPEHIVRKISGHAPGSKEFYRYVAFAQSYQDKEASLMFARLKEKVLTA